MASRDGTLFLRAIQSQVHSYLAFVLFFAPPAVNTLAETTYFDMIGINKRSIIYIMGALFIIPIFLAGVLALLLFFGLIGPQWLKDRMHRFNTWYYKDSAFFFPLDPYKPIGTAIKEGLKHFWPDKDRRRQYRRYILFSVTIFIIMFLALLFVMVIIAP